MKETLMDILCCPLDKEELELEVIREDQSEGGDQSEEVREVLEGQLTCTECGTEYQITDGIPNLLPPDMRE